MQQDIINWSVSYNDSVITAVFVWPIVSTDRNEDLDLNQCIYLGWGYGGQVNSTVPPVILATAVTNIGVFDMQMCLQNCQGIKIS